MENISRSKNFYLSKSLYIKGLQCHKSLWLTKNQPELKAEISTTQQAMFDSGTDTGILAQGLFPDGVEIPYAGLSHIEQLAKTQEALNNGERTIYEAAFSFDNVFVKIDILHKASTGWEIYEVKSSTQCKDVYLEDIAVQYHVVVGTKLSIARTCLVHINNQYVRNGDIEVDKLFSIQDVTEAILSLQSTVTSNLTAMRTVLNGAMPIIDIGPHCNNPYECDFIEHCWSHIPENSVFDLHDIGKPDLFKLYRDGIVYLRDVPMEVLNWRQSLQMNGYLNQKNVINVEAVKRFLNTLWYPLCFLDFETTFMTPVPLFDGTKPYQQVPFQYSLHVLENVGAELKHYEFLAPAGENPQMPLLKRLLEDMAENACILTWNQGFEKGRLRELAKCSPADRQRIEAIIANIRDLMIPFRQKDIYYWQFGGSYSIKSVLPAMVPDLSYENLVVNNGEMAANAWLRICQENDKEKIAELRRQLLEYCHLDTLAMVRILEKMEEFVI